MSAATKTRPLLLATLASALVAITILALAYPRAATPSTSGCSVNIKFHNAMPTDVDDPAYIHVNLYQSKVKIKGGLWKRLRDSRLSTVELPPNATTEQRTFNLAFGCGVKRRYKFFIREYTGYGHYSAGSKTVYFPGPNTWTERQSFKVDLRIAN